MNQYYQQIVKTWQVWLVGWFYLHYWVCNRTVLLFLGLPIDFWSAPSASEIQNGPVDLVVSTSGNQGQTSVIQDRCTLLTRGRQGKLCFINPLFLQLEVSKVSHKKLSTFVAFVRLRGFLRLHFWWFLSSLSKIKPWMMLDRMQRDYWKGQWKTGNNFGEKVNQVFFGFHLNAPPLWLLVQLLSTLYCNSHCLKDWLFKRLLALFGWRSESTFFFSAAATARKPQCLQ